LALANGLKPPQEMGFSPITGTKVPYNVSFIPLAKANGNRFINQSFLIILLSQFKSSRYKKTLQPLSIQDFKERYLIFSGH
jgi:hypothetical protein